MTATDVLVILVFCVVALILVADHKIVFILMRKVLKTFKPFISLFQALWQLRKLGGNEDKWVTQWGKLHWNLDLSYPKPVLFSLYHTVLNRILSLLPRRAFIIFWTNLFHLNNSYTRKKISRYLSCASFSLICYFY